MKDTCPRDVFERAHAYVREYDLRFADCFAIDGVLEVPIAPVISEQDRRACGDPSASPAQLRGSKEGWTKDRGVPRCQDPRDHRIERHLRV